MKLTLNPDKEIVKTTQDCMQLKVNCNELEL